MNNIDSMISAAAESLGVLLSSRGFTIAVAESCTGGGIAQAITEVSGSSQWFECGFVTYSNESKHAMLDVSLAIIERQGAVSEAVVREMAKGTIRKAGTNIAIAVSGIAGPLGGTIEKPVGTVWLAWIVDSARVEAMAFHFDGSRSLIRKKAVLAALGGACQRLR